MDMSQSRRKEGIKTIGENCPKKVSFYSFTRKTEYYILLNNQEKLTFLGNIFFALCGEMNIEI